MPRPLIDIIEDADLDELNAALAAGANVNEKYTDNVTPLIAVARRQLVRMTDWSPRSHSVTFATALLDAGADVNAAEKTGWSSLNWAVAATDLELVRLLVARGAEQEVAVKNDFMETGWERGDTAPQYVENMIRDMEGCAKADYELEELAQWRNIAAALGGDAAEVAEAAPSELPVEGRWNLVEVEYLAAEDDDDGGFGDDGEGEVMSAEELGLTTAHIEFGADGSFVGEYYNEERGSWRLRDGAIVLEREHDAPESLRQKSDRLVRPKHDPEHGRDMELIYERVT